MRILKSLREKEKILVYPAIFSIFPVFSSLSMQNHMIPATFKCRLQMPLIWKVQISSFCIKVSDFIVWYKSLKFYRLVKRLKFYRLVKKSRVSSFGIKVSNFIVRYKSLKFHRLVKKSRVSSFGIKVSNFIVCYKSPRFYRLVKN